jgi:hypothetical protein
LFGQLPFSRSHLGTRGKPALAIAEIMGKKGADNAFSIPLRPLYEALGFRLSGRSHRATHHKHTEARCGVDNLLLDIGPRSQISVKLFFAWNDRLSTGGWFLVSECLGTGTAKQGKRQGKQKSDAEADHDEEPSDSVPSERARQPFLI